MAASCSLPDSPSGFGTHLDELDARVLKALVARKRARGDLFLNLSSKFIAHKIGLRRDDASERRVWLSLRRLKREGLAFSITRKPLNRWAPTLEGIAAADNGGVQG